MNQIGLALLCVFGLSACRCFHRAPETAQAEEARPRVEAEKVAVAREAPKQAAPAQETPKRTSEPPASGAKVDTTTVSAAHADALRWIESQQQADGGWSEPAQFQHDEIGLTGLALLALQSDGSTMSSGSHAPAIKRGVEWLIGRQNKELGLIGQRTGHTFGYNHAIATQALCVALRNTPADSADPLRKAAQNAVNFIAQMRNPYGAWRYSYPPTGDNDTSVTGWMVEALIAAQAAGLEVDKEAYVGARQWIEEVTDPSTARIGYDTIGSGSSRVTGVNDQFPTDRHEAMTASGMLTRMNTGAMADPMLPRHAQLLQKHPPEWDVEAKLVDEYYWYFGSLAMHRLGGKAWDNWGAAARTALLQGQNRSGANQGSWDPVGPWGYAGRVYATSLNALSLSTML